MEKSVSSVSRKTLRLRSDCNRKVYIEIRHKSVVSFGIDISNIVASVFVRSTSPKCQEIYFIVLSRLNVQNSA